SIYILPEGLCERDLTGQGNHVCYNNATMLENPHSAVHEFTHHLFSLTGEKSWTQNEGLAEYTQYHYSDAGQKSLVGNYLDQVLQNCSHLPQNWRDYDGSPEDLCGVSYQCDVTTGESASEGWDNTKDCREYKYHSELDVFYQNYPGEDYGYTWEEFKTDIKWDDPYSGDHNRGLAFFLELENKHQFNLTKLGNYLKDLKLADDAETTKAKLATATGLNTATFNALWDKYEMSETYEQVAFDVN
ncbi:MAG: hypothetical protein GOV15_00975, partial [Candidatus Diapherotrites archaeon]|nr:hypothetical protein [Candidatus Diapherotrites archaeon]